VQSAIDSNVQVLEVQSAEFHARAWWCFVVALSLSRAQTDGLDPLRKVQFCTL
jgi:hypothetical protein